MHAKQQPANDEHTNNRRKPGRNRASATLRVPPNNDDGKHHKHAIGGGIIDGDSGPGRRKESCHRDMVSFTQVQGHCRQRHSSVTKHWRIPHKREFVIRPRSDEEPIAGVAVTQVPSARPGMRALDANLFRICSVRRPSTSANDANQRAVNPQAKQHNRG